MGVDKERLEPVNYERHACADILACTGVDAAHGDIQALAQQHRRAKKRFSLVWLDLQSKTVDAAGVRASLEIAPYVCVTLSTRAADADAIVSAAIQTIKKCGGTILEAPARYKGLSNITNVARILATSTSRTSAPHDEAAMSAKKTKSDAGMDVEADAEQQKRAAEGQEKRLAQIAARKAARVAQAAAWSKERAAEKAARKAQKQAAKAAEAQARQKRAQAAVGAHLRIPSHLFVPPPIGIKQIDGALCYVVTGVYCKVKLKLNAVSPDGAVYKEHENWVLTPERVMEYKTDVDDASHSAAPPSDALVASSPDAARSVIAHPR